MSLASVGRKRKILELLEANGKVKVKDLAVILKVSTETIRKYLDDLQEEGNLTKVYGGAINPVFFNKEPPSIEREIINKDAKERIGKIAVSVINDNDVIAIDDGSTPFQLAKNLKGKKNLTIITSSINSLSVLMNLISRGSFSGKIVLLGGEIDPIHHRIIGELSMEMLNNIYVDKYFISADGLSKVGGVTSFDVSKGMITKKLIEQSNKSILLLDHTKMGKRTYFKMAELEELSMVISDQEFSDDWKLLFEKSKVTWLIADENEAES